MPTIEDFPNVCKNGPMNTEFFMKNNFSLLWAACLFGAGTTLAQSVVELPVSLADAGTTVQNVLTQDPRAGQNNVALGGTEGPAVDSAGNLFFSEYGRSLIWRVPPVGTATVFTTVSSQTLGMDFDPQGRLVMPQNGIVLRFNTNGTRDTLIRNGSGLTLGGLNDLSITSAGHIMITNHSNNRLFLLNPNGTLLDSVTIAGTPNGIEYVEETQTVYVTQSGSNSVTRFNWSPTSGPTFRTAALARTNFIPSVPFPDGITMDSLRNLYVVSNSTGTVVVYSPAGDSIGRITVRGRAMSNATNCVFGGPGNRTLYITGNGGVYSVQLKVAGRRRPLGTTAIHAWRILPMERGKVQAETFDLMGRSFPRWKGYGLGKIRIIQ